MSNCSSNKIKLELYLKRIPNDVNLDEICGSIVFK